MTVPHIAQRVNIKSSYIEFNAFMKEFLLNGPKSLTKTLDLLNKIFIFLENSTDEKKKSFLKNFKNLVEKKSEEKAWEYLCEKADSPNNQKRVIVDPTVIFQIWLITERCNKAISLLYLA
ncbi:MAG: hypothetical protein K0U52_02865 [Gammaproteobacteria bacterium]|nr:hypothetical protein [Gammaproteobacteria bacterium]